MGDIRITPIEADRYYHIYNRGINGDIIFKSDRNKDFFLKKITDLLLPVCEILCYCLLNNHFHLLIRVHSDGALKEFALQSKKTTIIHEKGLHSADRIFSKQLSRVFNSYSQAFNKENNRHGPLIESPFKRKVITSEDYLRSTIIYIHQNPMTHGLTDDFRNFKYSSFRTIMSGQKTELARNEVLQYFETRENFLLCHNRIVDETEI